MGLLGPSAVEHTTGVVFRVGTPGRLAGRCLWPSLSSRKSKATGVEAVPFPLSLLFITFVFYPSTLSLSSFFPFLFFILSICTYILPCFNSLPSILTTSRFRAVSAGLITSLNFFLGVRVVEHTRVSAEYGRVS